MRSPIIRTLPDSRRHAAFTLVELLVVIGIIAILVAFLLPALQRAKEHANKARCLANLRQIGMGVALYVNENSQWWPPGSGQSQKPAVFPDTPTWGRVIAGQMGVVYITEQNVSPGFYPREKYDPSKIKDNGVFNCPSDHLPNRQRARNANSYAHNSGYSQQPGVTQGLGFGISWAYKMIPAVTAGEKLLQTRYSPIKTSQIKHSARLVYAGETDLFQTLYLQWGGVGWFEDIQNQYWKEGPYGTIHRGYGNYLFADFHAESRLPGEMNVDVFDRTK